MKSLISEARVLEALREVVDPEMGINVVDLGLVEKIDCSAAGIWVSLGMTSPACPVTPLICRNAQEALLKIPEVEKAEVQPAKDFHWSPDRMSPLARQMLGSPVSPPAAVDQPEAEKKDQPLLQKPKIAVNRLPLLAFGMISLIGGVWAGLVRLGWEWPLLEWQWIVWHGPLMVCGFLGTVIGLERAVGLRKKWAYVAPGAAALGAVSLLAARPGPGPAILMIVSSLFLTLIFMNVLKTHRDLATFTLGLGAFCWLVGNLLWLSNNIFFLLIPWWMAFLVLTIAGERLELNRFLEPTPWVIRSFVACVGIILTGCVISIGYLDTGTRILSAGLIALAVWLGTYDIARRTIRQQGVPRFAAVSLLLGYFWLAVAGIIGIIAGGQAAGPAYDAFLHALFLGFVFSMIFGHAPIIFPSILNRQLNFSKVFYIHLLILHLGLVIRTVGNLANIWELRLGGGLINAVAIGLFILNTVYAVLSKES